MAIYDRTARGTQLPSYHVLTCSIRHGISHLESISHLAAHRDRVLSSLAVIPPLVHPLVYHNA